jgi:hypothetical protein
VFYGNRLRNGASIILRSGRRTGDT